MVGRGLPLSSILVYFRRAEVQQKALVLFLSGEKLSEETAVHSKDEVEPHLLEQYSLQVNRPTDESVWSLRQ